MTAKRYFSGLRWIAASGAVFVSTVGPSHRSSRNRALRLLPFLVLFVSSSGPVLTVKFTHSHNPCLHPPPLPPRQ
ncbi:hypothetical protein BDM02DRAFT_3116186 [Thelephora ganbajun]|uniref:Uncharacterized protein n=1 Tax=Thelephora ganbajun TaxID=370292 RepID=A0ACB6ZEL7_THEGA|nr:hypothetical protein BDM02DRAFT_3116186 [Thelephora ganbajun]